MSLDPLIVTIDTLTLNLASAEQEVADLKAKLEKVEADAAVIRGIITSFADRWVMGEINEDDDVVALLRLADDSTGTGQALLDELATLRETAQRRLNLLREIRGVSGLLDCPAVDWSSMIDAELKATP